MAFKSFCLLALLLNAHPAAAFDQLDGGVPISRREIPFLSGDFKEDTIPTGDPARRDARVYLPTNFDGQKKWPVVLLLHGYEESQGIIDAYFGLDAEVTKRGFILVVPEGLKDKAPSPGPYHYWNASDACCDLYGSKVNDTKYLTGLADEVIKKYNGDESRVYAAGHSNGAFMAHNLACNSAEHFAAIAAFAGMTTKDPAQCHPSSPVSLLQINAVDDSTIHFGGGKTPDPLQFYPGADDSVNRWVTLNHCAPGAAPGPSLDLTLSIPGIDTSTRTWSGCEGGSVVKQDTIKATDPAKIPGLIKLISSSTHFPVLTAGFTAAVLDFLLSQKKPAAPPAP